MKKLKQMRDAFNTRIDSYLSKHEIKNGIKKLREGLLDIDKMYTAAETGDMSKLTGIGTIANSRLAEGLFVVAAGAGQKEVVEYMLKEGVSPEAKEHFGESKTSAEDKACENGFTEVADLIKNSRQRLAQNRSQSKPQL